MKRYDVVLGRSGGRPHARCDETPEGAYVRHYVAQRLIDAKQAEIDALKAQNAELLAALESIVTKNAIYHRPNDNHEWTLSKHQPDGIQEAIDLIAKINGNQAIAKARGDL